MGAPIHVELSEAEAYALVRLADCAANTYDDALGVLDVPRSVAAGFRALDKLWAALAARRERVS